MFDVEAARGDIGRDKEIGLLRAKARHHLIALPLLHAAVQRLGAIAVRVQPFDQRIDVEPRPAEYDGGGRALDVQHAPEDLGLLRAMHEIRDLPDSRQLAGRGLLARDRNPLRVLQMPLRDGQNARRQRR